MSTMKVSIKSLYVILVVIISIGLILLVLKIMLEIRKLYNKPVKHIDDFEMREMRSDLGDQSHESSLPKIH